LPYVQANGMREGAEERQRALSALTAPSANAALELCDGRTLDLIASFQHAVVGVLIRQTLAAAEAYGARSVVVSGGVAANRELRRRFSEEAKRSGLRVEFPSLALSTDNAAMIAAAAWPRLLAGEFAEEDMGATPQLKLGS
jgi:N6-L-threonylcarbamoyladenine synthase